MAKGEERKQEIMAKSQVKIYENQREADVAEANAQLATKKAGNASVDYDIKVQEANSDLYKKQKAAEAVFYEKERAAEAQRVAAEAQLYAVQQAADAELFAKRKEVERLVAIAEAQGVYIRILLASLGGNYNALRDYLMIDGVMFKDITKIIAEAVQGLQPKISVWSNGGKP
ncbi:hypothetical protein ACH5RR_023530 [Cinchona calisaya]|uniref:Flotillin-like n=1 Tax=Cinchona calisaya TaxID=153742 RepID=A0ABD2ZB06_9GENT